MFSCICLGDFLCFSCKNTKHRPKQATQTQKGFSRVLTVALRKQSTVLPHGSRQHSSSAAAAPSRGCARRALPVASGAIGLSGVDIIADHSGNGTAFALHPGVVPTKPPSEEPVRYDIDTFSPGFVLDNVLGAEECAKIKDICEQAGWAPRFSQGLSVVTIFLDEALERRIFERVRDFLPNHMGGKPIGINRRWAVIKYEPGEYMNPHIDGHVPGTERLGDELKYAKGTRSYMTALFWLADDVVGGETVFTFPQGGTWVKIPPKTGAALFFNHGQNAVSNPMHHGGSVTSGVKYLVRADVIYGHGPRGSR
eukprot:TRINITY_DN21958_c1_g1_i4.p1 TRINITY_DN21958_c1_g1~~TRINITY_DN21958_c1_g1_i4.p1  ORF type:complete len:340 (+),score=23.31 TRINITY_DN21958_c1_g1_i4:93-1022(+)